MSDIYNLFRIPSDSEISIQQFGFLVRWKDGSVEVVSVDWNANPPTHQRALIFGPLRMPPEATAPTPLIPDTGQPMKSA